MPTKTAKHYGAIEQSVQTFLAAGKWWTPRQVYNAPQVGASGCMSYSTFCQSVMRPLLERKLIQTRPITSAAKEPMYWQFARPGEKGGEPYES